MARPDLLNLMATIYMVVVNPTTSNADVEVECIPFDTSEIVARWERGTIRRMDVFAVNNTTSIIDGADWKPTIPPSLQGFLADVTAEPDRRPFLAEDFFDGVAMFFSVYAPINSASGAVVEGNGAVPGSQGSLQRYDIMIAADAPLGSFDYLHVDMFFYDPSFNPVASSVVDNRTFRIMPSKGDVNGDGFVDGGDVVVFAEALLANPTLQTGENFAGEYCDWSGNDDNQIDGADVQNFITNYIDNGS